jgi:hypothetical protein
VSRPYLRASLAIGLLSAAPASAQLMGARELTTTAIVKGAPASKPVPDIYYLVGESGARETYALTGKGPASLTLFGPDGSEILTASGNGKVKLEVVLPFTDVFTIAVARTTPANGYSLTRKTSLPTLAEAYMASNVGYAFKRTATNQCWVIPGVKSRTNFENGTRHELTLAADRTTVSVVSREANGTFTGDVSYKFVGDELHQITRRGDGKVIDRSIPFDPSYDPEEVDRYTGYLCKD